MRHESNGLKSNSPTSCHAWWRPSLLKTATLTLAAGLAGCTAGGSYAHRAPAATPASEIATIATAEAPQAPRSVDAELVAKLQPPSSASTSIPPTFEDTVRLGLREDPGDEIVAVSHQDGVQAKSTEGTLTIAGRRYRMQLVEDEPSSPVESSSFRTAAHQTASDLPASVPPAEPASPLNEVVSEINTLPLNLPTALSMVGGDHPIVGFAQWRVQEAYARVAQAEVLWLPSIQAGFSFHRHDGNYQASNGDIVDVNRNSFQYGLGAGATGAGTTPNPGLVAQFHLADAIFQPDVARKNAWAEGHAANGVMNRQLLDVALAYLELLHAEQDVQIIQESRERATAVAKLTADFASTGQGLQADADRLDTELSLLRNRLAAGQERAHVASTRLSQALSLNSRQRISPLDAMVVPLQLVSLEQSEGGLISTGLSTRPELKEAQALVAAACDQYQRQKYAPFVPSVLLGFSTGQSGGGLGGNIGSVNDRYDFDAMVTWEVRNLGFGERAARQETAAQVQQAKFRKLRLLDQVAQEISEAYAQVTHRSGRMQITQTAIRTATDSYERNLGRIRDGQGLPLEALQSVQALESARRAYLESVVAYNEAQFRLQWSLGWPVFSPAAE